MKPLHDEDMIDATLALLIVLLIIMGTGFFVGWWKYIQ